MRFRHIAVLPVLCACVLPVVADDDIDQIAVLSQAEFRDLASDLGATVSYKAVIPIVSLGIAGFDMGAEVTATRIAHRDTWNRASSGGGPSTVYVPKLHIHKGLPAGIDVGAFYAAIPDTNIDVWGAEIRYALVDGGVATPAVGLRGTYSKMSGVDQLALNTKSLELGISKGFTVVTPYAGVGRVWTDAEPAAGTGRAPESLADTKLYAGASFNLLLGNFALEADRTGEVTSYSVKVGFRF